MVVLTGGTALITSGSMAPADLLPFLLLGLGLTAPVAALGHDFDDMQAAGRAVGRIGAILAVLTLAEPAHPVAPRGHRVEFRDVRFGYEADHEVLRGIDLTLEPGTVTAIVGPSGSGKSTLVQLLPRFFDPTHGSIELGGVDLRAIGSHNLHRTVSFVFQDVRLLRASVADNIALAVPHAEPGDIARGTGGEHQATSRVIEYLQAQPVLRTGGRTVERFGLLDDALREMQRASRRSAFSALPGMIGSALTVQSIFTVLLALGAALALGGDVGVAEVSLAELSGTLRTARAELGRLDAVMRTELLPQSLEPIVPETHDLAFESVTFDQAGRTVLDDVSFAVPAGARLAIVFQDAYLFDGTIEENVRLGRPEATDAEIRAAAAAARLDEVVERLPGGWAAHVGEGGALLSGVNANGFRSPAHC